MDMQVKFVFGDIKLNINMNSMTIYIIYFFSELF